MKVFVLETGVEYEGHHIISISQTTPIFRDVKKAVESVDEHIRFTQQQYLELITNGEVTIEKEYRWLSLKEYPVKP